MQTLLIEVSLFGGMGHSRDSFECAGCVVLDVLDYGEFWRIRGIRRMWEPRNRLGVRAPAVRRLEVSRTCCVRRFIARVSRKAGYRPCIRACLPREAYYRPRIRGLTVRGVLSPVYSCAYRVRRFIARVFRVFVCVPCEAFYRPCIRVCLP